MITGAEGSVRVPSAMNGRELVWPDGVETHDPPTRSAATRHKSGGRDPRRLGVPVDSNVIHKDVARHRRRSWSLLRGPRRRLLEAARDVGSKLMLCFYTSHRRPVPRDDAAARRRL